MKIRDALMLTTALVAASITSVFAADPGPAPAPQQQSPGTARATWHRHG